MIQSRIRQDHIIWHVQEAQGEFNLNNLRDGKYLMFAITDVNADYIYNLPSEDISFADTLIKPHIPAAKTEKPDSLPKDSVQIIAGIAFGYFATTFQGSRFDTKD